MLFSWPRLPRPPLRRCSLHDPGHKSRITKRHRRYHAVMQGRRCRLILCLQFSFVRISFSLRSGRSTYLLSFRTSTRPLFRGHFFMAPCRRFSRRTTPRLKIPIPSTPSLGMHYPLPGIEPPPEMPRARRCGAGLAAAPRARQSARGEGPNVRLPIPIAAFRAQGRLSQLSANCGLMQCNKKHP